MWTCRQCRTQNWGADEFCRRRGCGSPRRATNDSAISEHPPEEQSAYILILGPGRVRYFGFDDFLTLDVEQFIETLQRISADLLVKAPPEIALIDQLVATQPWEKRLRFQHGFFKENFLLALRPEIFLK
jgi:hypothetical protein